MPAFALLAMLFVVILSGEISRQRVLNDAVGSPPGFASSAAYGFVAYKAAVQLFVFKNPGTSGSIPLATLGLDPASLGGITAGNEVNPGVSGTVIETWIGSGSVALDDILRVSNGNLSIGVSSGTRWSTPSGGDMGALPVAVPAGQIVSVVTFSGTGFSQG